MESVEQLQDIIYPLLDGMGLSLVDLSISRHKGDIKVNLVLYKENGITLDDLTEAQKILRPRLELEYERENLSMEISSPGVSRTIKSPREYRIFTGRRFRLLIDEEWMEGTVKKADENSIEFETENETTQIPISGIRKAKLV